MMQSEMDSFRKDMRREIDKAKSDAKPKE